MKRSQRTRRRSLMIETSNHQVRRSRQIRRKLPEFAWIKNLQLGKFSTWGIIFCTVMALFIAIAVLSPVFRIQKFHVIQKSIFVESTKAEDVLEKFKGKNMLFLQKNDVRAALRKEMPELRDIKIDENWPRSVEITIDAAKPKYNIFNTETTNFSVIAEDGIVLTEQSIDGLPVIKIFQHEDVVKKRQQIFSSNQLLKINEAEGILDAELMLPVTAVEVYLAANELHFISRGGMSIWLDLSRSVRTQLDKLSSAEGKINLYKENIDHLDLRIPQQIFWK